MIELRVGQDTFQRLPSVEQIDVVCDAFESELRSGINRPLEQYIGLVDPQDAPDLRRELALLDRDGDELGHALNRDDALDTNRSQDDTQRECAQPFSNGLPKRFENYLLIEEIGRGTSGVVYLAEDLDLGNLVAIKLPHRSCLATPTDRLNFLREGRNAARLSHDCIVPIIRVGQWQSTPFIVSEFVRGVDLRRWLQQCDRQLSHGEIARLIADLASAVHHAHCVGIIHRDLKPSNIIIDESTVSASRSSTSLDADPVGEQLLKPRLLDFGISKLIGSTAGDTHQGDMLGTPAYMCPEQACGKADQADGRSDVYSLGIILYELLSGSTPFCGNTAQILEQIRSGKVVSVRAKAPDTPRALAAICHHCLQPKPDDRYATASALAIDLQHWLDGESVAASWSAIHRWLPRKRTLVALAVVVVFCGVIAAASLAVVRHQENVLRAKQIARLRELRSASPNEFPQDDAGERSAAEQARIVMELFKLGDTKSVWPALRTCPDPRVRTYFTHFLSLAEAPVDSLVDRLPAEQDASVQYGILICLGLRDLSKVGSCEEVIRWCENAYLKHPDSGVHSACLWLLTRWGQSGFLRAANQQLKTEGIVTGRNWHVSPSGILFVHCTPPASLLIGAPNSVAAEKWERERKGFAAKCYAIAAFESSEKMYQAFIAKDDSVRDSMSESEPAKNLSAIDGFEFCKWLDEIEGVPNEDRAIVSDPSGEISVNILKRGYRLPTDGEWEYACKARTKTNTYFGSRIAIFRDNYVFPKNSISPEQLVPNPIGSFSMLDGVREWVSTPFLNGKDKNWDGNGALKLVKSKGTFLCGGNAQTAIKGIAFFQRLPMVMSRPTTESGFRICRTICAE